MAGKAPVIPLQYCHVPCINSPAEVSINGNVPVRLVHHSHVFKKFVTRAVEESVGGVVSDEQKPQVRESEAALTVSIVPAKDGILEH